MKSAIAPIARVGLIANTEKPRCRAIVRRVARALRAARRTLVCDAETAQFLPAGALPVASLTELAATCDLLLVVGGDGTILRVAREIAGARPPILGINAGNLGFLAAVPPDRLAESLRRVLAGRFVIDERALLEGAIQRGAASLVQTALNDFVLSRGLTSRLIELEVSVNGELLTRYRCDGLIVSSPTGSTAYSLAAGGAIVSPDTEVLMLTPICPHTLNIRPVVVSLRSAVRVRLVSPRLVAILAADGQHQTELSTGDHVTIRRSARAVGLARLEGASFFATLRQKFGWSGSHA